MSSPTTETPTQTTQTTPSKGVGMGIRVSVALFIATALGLFMLFWDGTLTSWSPWLGRLVFTPLLAVVLGFFGNSVIQQVSCGYVQWLVQFQRTMMIPLPFLMLWGVLYLVPSLRWPIEGLVQKASPSIRQGLSSGFYTFWIGLYTQAFMNGLAQICPK